MSTSPAAGDGPFFLTKFAVPGMDCPSEEQVIRMALGDVGAVMHLQFDLTNRTLQVTHAGASEELLDRLRPLGFGARLESTVEASGQGDFQEQDPAGEARVLKQVLAINAAMFAVELAAGIVAQSAGLIADSLDMLADATVYGVSLYVIGRAVAQQRRAAKLSGVLQFLLALGVLLDVGRRALEGSEPVELMMIGIALLALGANLACVGLLAKHRGGGAHLKASWIFTTTDALANVGVIFAGVLVFITGSSWPDLVVGACVGLLVLWSAIRILRL